MREKRGSAQVSGQNEGWDLGVRVVHFTIVPRSNRRRKTYIFLHLLTSQSREQRSKVVLKDLH